MSCQKCKSARIATIGGKTSDLCIFAFDGKERIGYVPFNVGVGGGNSDMLEFEYCLECGQIQGDFPITKSAVEEVFEDGE